MPARWYRALLILIIAIGVGRIVSTYRVFSQTIDEPAHIAGGIEWLDRGTYDADPAHPPLARISAALWPYLSGIRAIASGNFVLDGNNVFYAGGRYSTNLSRSRAGILPFFIAGTWIVASWARRLWGDVAGLIAALLFSNEPNILAHSGLVTTDMAAATLTVATAYVFWRWLDDGGPRSSVLGPRPAVFGVVLGLAVLAKFSTLLFVPAALLAVLLCSVVRDRTALLKQAPVALLAALVVAIGYRFHLSDFFYGIRLVREHAQSGHNSYLLGQFRDRGWWYYFPLAIALKTTLGFLMLTVTGALSVRRREEIAPLAAGLLILVVSLPVNINIGVRHVLPVYPFFAIVAAGAFTRYLRAGILLVVMAVVASIAAHPDYLPYFNALAGRHPDRIFVDSNLDWGQDLFRLRAELRRRGVKHFSIAYAGTADTGRHHLPPFVPLDQFRYTPGWIAISEVIAHSQGPQYRWLESFEPVGYAGKSIRLYNLPPVNESPALKTILLLPVWFQGTFRGASAWSCDLAIENSGDTAITIPTPSPVLVPARSTIRNPRLGLGDARDGALIAMNARDAAHLRMTLTLTSGSGQSVELPVVREGDYKSAEITFGSVPVSDAASATLRIYDLSGEAGSVTVHLSEGNDSATATVNLSHGGSSAPSAVSVALNRLFPGRDLHSARVSIAPPSSTYWACVTVSERDTNRAYVILP